MCHDIITILLTVSKKIKYVQIRFFRWNSWFDLKLVQISRHKSPILDAWVRLSYNTFKKRRRSKVDVRVTRSGRFGLFSVINDLFYLYFTSFSWFLNLKILLCFIDRLLLLTFLHLCISPIPWNRWSKLVSYIHGLCYCVFLCVWCLVHELK